MTTRARGWTVAALVAAVALLVTSVAAAVTWTAASAGTSAGVPAAWSDADQGVTGTDLPGTVVDVVVGDMARGRGMMGDADRMGGRMILRTDRVDVPAGTVSLRVSNVGSVDHEVVVLPLDDGQQVGERAIRRDGTVDERGSLAEASRTGGGGAGEGIEPGGTGWVTLDLAPGRYELVCNLPGHYAAGMYALLVVT
jgi:uncharacterized cupredoxin-like copper-binding protein